MLEISYGNEVNRLSFKFKGMRKLERKLEQLANNAEKLNGTHEVPLVDLFNDAFMKENSDFNTFEEFAESSPFDFSNLDSIDENALDAYVSSQTKFSSWSKMLNEASSLWAVKQLDL